MVAGLVVGTVACSGGDDDAAASTSTTRAAGASTSTSTTAGSDRPTAAELCDHAVLDPQAPPAANDDLTEVSGVAVSRTNPGVLWMHDDSGGGPEAFAVNAADGADRGRYPLQGAEAHDWEDIALGPAPGGAAGHDDLYLADIGDNASQRSNVTVYRVAEPSVPASGGGATLTGVDSFTLTYADGARDAETLLADPDTGDLFVVSKQWDGKPTGLYRIPAGTAPGASVRMERVADVPVPKGQLVTGGDISADGSVIALRTYGNVLLWDRSADQTVDQALAGDPCEAPTAPEIQGEAIGLLPDGAGYVTLSEGGHPAIHRFHLP
jgi:hypothetical protein